MSEETERTPSLYGFQKERLYQKAKQLEATEGWRLGEGLFELYPDVYRLKAECAFPMNEMPYKGNVVEFNNGNERWGFVRSTLATAVKYGLPYVYQKQGELEKPIKFGGVVACVRPEDLETNPVPGIREGVFAQADLEYASNINSSEEYVDLNIQLIWDSARWLASLGLPPEQIQVRINNFTEILFDVLSCDKGTIDPLLVQTAWGILNEVDRSSFERDFRKVSELKGNANTLLQTALGRNMLDKQQTEILTGWIDEAACNSENLQSYPKARKSLKELERIKSGAESCLQGTKVVVSPYSYRITPHAYSGVTFQIDAIGSNGRRIAEIAGGGDYTQTALNYWRAQYREPDGNICFTGIAFGLMRISTLLNR